VKPPQHGRIAGGAAADAQPFCYRCARHRWKGLHDVYCPLGSGTWRSRWPLVTSSTSQSVALKGARPTTGWKALKNPCFYGR